MQTYVDASMPGLPLAAISVVDLAIWDLLGKIRKEPIYKMIGGRTKKDIPLYLTGPKPEVAQKLGFWGGKVPLPHGPPDGHKGLKANVEFLKAHREKVGPDFPIMVDCYMSLDVVSLHFKLTLLFQYTITSFLFHWTTVDNLFQFQLLLACCFVIMIDADIPSHTRSNSSKRSRMPA